MVFLHSNGNPKTLPMSMSFLQAESNIKQDKTQEGHLNQTSILVNIFLPHQNRIPGCLHTDHERQLSQCHLWKSNRSAVLSGIESSSYTEARAKTYRQLPGWLTGSHCERFIIMWQTSFERDTSSHHLPHRVNAGSTGQSTFIISLLPYLQTQMSGPPKGSPNVQKGV